MTLTTSSKPQPADSEDRAHALEYLPRLSDHVVSADEVTLAVHGDDPGDEHEVAGAHGVREVRDRLGETVDAILLAAHVNPPGAR